MNSISPPLTEGSSALNRVNQKYDDEAAKLEEYEVIKRLGAGRFGEVFLVRHKDTNETLCWKVISYKGLTDREKRQIVAEVNVMRELFHENIVRYHDRIIVKKMRSLYIVMEYCNAGDLASSLLDSKKHFHGLVEEAVLFEIAIQICSALAYCHELKGESGRSRRVLHRDLKPQNIFLCKPPSSSSTSNQQTASSSLNFIAKLGDFGLSRSMGVFSVAHSCVGTPYYWSPELLMDGTKNYDEKSDMWALGCTLYEIATGKTPFWRAQDLHHLKNEVTKGPEFPIKSLSERFNLLIRALLSKDPAARPSARQCLGYSIFKPLQISGDPQKTIGSKALAKNETSKTSPNSPYSRAQAVDAPFTASPEAAIRLSRQPSIRPQSELNANTASLTNKPPPISDRRDAHTWYLAKEASTLHHTNVENRKVLVGKGVSTQSSTAFDLNPSFQPSSNPTNTTGGIVRVSAEVSDVAKGPSPLRVSTALSTQGIPKSRHGGSATIAITPTTNSNVIGITSDLTQYNDQYTNDGGRAVISRDIWHKVSLGNSLLPPVEEGISNTHQRSSSHSKLKSANDDGAFEELQIQANAGGKPIVNDRELFVVRQPLKFSAVPSSIAERDDTTSTAVNASLPGETAARGSLVGSSIRTQSRAALGETPEWEKGSANHADTSSSSSEGKPPPNPERISQHFTSSNEQSSKAYHHCTTNARENNEVRNVRNDYEESTASSAFKQSSKLWQKMPFAELSQHRSSSSSFPPDSDAFFPGSPMLSKADAPASIDSIREKGLSQPPSPCLNQTPRSLLQHTARPNSFTSNTLQLGGVMNPLDEASDVAHSNSAAHNKPNPHTHTVSIESSEQLNVQGFSPGFNHTSCTSVRGSLRRDVASDLSDSNMENALNKVNQEVVEKRRASREFSWQSSGKLQGDGMAAAMLLNGDSKSSIPSEDEGTSLRGFADQPDEISRRSSSQHTLSATETLRRLRSFNPPSATIWPKQLGSTLATASVGSMLARDEATLFPSVGNVSDGFGGNSSAEIDGGESSPHTHSSSPPLPSRVVARRSVRDTQKLPPQRHSWGSLSPRADSVLPLGGGLEAASHTDNAPPQSRGMFEPSSHVVRTPRHSIGSALLSDNVDAEGSLHFIRTGEGKSPSLFTRIGKRYSVPLPQSTTILETDAYSLSKEGNRRLNLAPRKPRYGDTSDNASDTSFRYDDEFGKRSLITRQHTAPEEESTDCCTEDTIEDKKGSEKAMDFDTHSFTRKNGERMHSTGAIPHSYTKEGEGDSPPKPYFNNSHPDGNTVYSSSLRNGGGFGASREAGSIVHHSSSWGAVEGSQPAGGGGGVNASESKNFNPTCVPNSLTEKGNSPSLQYTSFHGRGRSPRGHSAAEISNRTPLGVCAEQTQEYFYDLLHPHSEISKKSTNNQRKSGDDFSERMKAVRSSFYGHEEANLQYHMPLSLEQKVFHYRTHNPANRQKQDLPSVNHSPFSGYHAFSPSPFDGSARRSITPTPRSDPFAALWRTKQRTFESTGTHKEEAFTQKPGFSSESSFRGLFDEIPVAAESLAYKNSPLGKALARASIRHSHEDFTGTSPAFSESNQLSMPKRSLTPPPCFSRRKSQDDEEFQNGLFAGGLHELQGGSNLMGTMPSTRERSMEGSASRSPGRGIPPETRRKPSPYTHTLGYTASVADDSRHTVPSYHNSHSQFKSPINHANCTGLNTASTHHPSSSATAPAASDTQSDEYFSTYRAGGDQRHLPEKVFRSFPKASNPSFPQSKEDEGTIVDMHTTPRRRFSLTGRGVHEDVEPVNDQPGVNRSDASHGRFHVWKNHPSSLLPQQSSPGTHNLGYTNAVFDARSTHSGGATAYEASKLRNATTTPNLTPVNKGSTAENSEIIAANPKLGRLLSEAASTDYQASMNPHLFTKNPRDFGFNEKNRASSSRLLRSQTNLSNLGVGGALDAFETAADCSSHLFNKTSSSSSSSFILGGRANDLSDVATHIAEDGLMNTTTAAYDVNTLSTPRVFRGGFPYLKDVSSQASHVRDGFEDHTRNSRNARLGGDSLEDHFRSGRQDRDSEDHALISRNADPHELPSKNFELTFTTASPTRTLSALKREHQGMTNRNIPTIVEDSRNAGIYDSHDSKSNHKLFRKNWVDSPFSRVRDDYARKTSPNYPSGSFNQGSNHVTHTNNPNTQQHLLFDDSPRYYYQREQSRSPSPPPDSSLRAYRLYHQNPQHLPPDLPKKLQNPFSIDRKGKSYFFEASNNSFPYVDSTASSTPRLLNINRSPHHTHTPSGERRLHTPPSKKLPYPEDSLSYFNRVNSRLPNPVGYGQGSIPENVENDELFFPHFKSRLSWQTQQDDWAKNRGNNTPIKASSPSLLNEGSFANFETKSSLSRNQRRSLTPPPNGFKPSVRLEPSYSYHSAAEGRKTGYFEDFLDSSDKGNPYLMGLRKSAAPPEFFDEVNAVPLRNDEASFGEEHEVSPFFYFNPSKGERRRQRY